MPKALLVAHLDLKGVQYRHNYYPEYLDNLKALGYDAVLVEYEDVFPFRSASFSRHPDEVWSHGFLRSFLEMARSKGLEVIPLQQCLSHLEYAFEWVSNRRFCLPYGTPRDLHIGLPEARQWLRTLLEEVLTAHPDSRYVHLGMDEARPLLTYAKVAGKEVLPLFLDYLEELCALCREHGKMPLIWSDMLEDHIEPAYLERILSFREKVILVPWYYAEDARPQEVVRFSGMRCSRRWMDDVENAPVTMAGIRDDFLWFEDWPPEIQALVAKHRVSPWQMESLFQAAVWKKLGFTVWGGAGGGITQDRSILPYYHWRANNIARWKECIARYELDGLIITQWARSTSCSVPNVIPDVAWPLLAKAGSPTHSAAAFFPELDPEVLDRLVFRVGKCRENWNVENSLLKELKELQPFIRQHRHEWETMILMLRILRVRKAIDDLKELSECYGGIGRLAEVAWEDQRQGLLSSKQEMLELRDEARRHLEKRYYGHALEEWFYKVFTSELNVVDRTVCAIEKAIKAFVERDAKLFEEKVAPVSKIND